METTSSYSLCLFQGPWTQRDAPEVVKTLDAVSMGKVKVNIAGGGYFSSLHAGLHVHTTKMALQAGGWPTFKSNGKATKTKGKPPRDYIPPVLLDIRHFRNVMRALDAMSGDDICMHFHSFFFAASRKAKMPFSWFGARRVLERHAGTLAPEKVHASRPLQERIGVPTYGYMGAGGMRRHAKFRPDF